MLRTKDFCVISLVGILLALGACATSPIPFFADDSALSYDENALTRGEISLDCDSLLCSFRWFTKRSALAALYEEGDWDSLSEEVSALEYGQDLAYFYLGRAAEEKQAYDAAQLYFTRAQSSTLRCSNSFFSRCKDIDVTESSRERSEHIAAMLAVTEMDLADAQAVLSDMGLYTAKVDGIYGPRTRAALQQFQESRRLSKTGKLDQATIRALVAAEASALRRIADSSRPASPSKASAAPKPATEPGEADPALVAVAVTEAKTEKPPYLAAPTVAPKLADSTAPAPSSEPEVVEATPAVVLRSDRSAPKVAQRSTAATLGRASSELASADVPDTRIAASEAAPINTRGTVATTTDSVAVEAADVRPATAEPTPIKATTTMPKAAEATPLVALDSTSETAKRKLNTEDASAPEPAALAPVSARAPALESAAIAPGVPSSEEAETPTPANDVLEVAAMMDTRRFAPEREAERTRLKLEVDLLSQADPFADVLGVVEQGAWVSVIDWGSEWSKVSHGDATGYVYTEVLQ
ncbi:MAG: peptidoglycan-binding protein [Pseudomonadota bacterium]